MVKLTSFVTLIAIVASIAAAPIETNTTATTTISAPSSTATLDAVPTALPEDLVENIEDAEIGIASKDPFSTSITHRGKATWVSKRHFIRILHSINLGRSYRCIPSNLLILYLSFFLVHTSLWRLQLLLERAQGARCGPLRPHDGTPVLGQPLLRPPRPCRQPQPPGPRGHWPCCGQVPRRWVRLWILGLEPCGVQAAGPLGHGHLEHHLELSVKLKTKQQTNKHTRWGRFLLSLGAKL